MGKKKNRGKKPKQASTGGSMTNMRSGFKSAVGQGKKKKKPKRKITMIDVLIGGFAIAIAVYVIWSMNR